MHIRQSVWLFLRRRLPLVLSVLVIILGSFACSEGGKDEGNVGLTPDPEHHTFTVAWQPPGIADVNINITPSIPPKQLDAYPGSYIDVTATFKGQIIFKTDDPYYQCFEALTVAGAGILIFKAPSAASAIAGQLFVVAYNKCGPLLQHENRQKSHLGMIANSFIDKNKSDYVVLYTFTEIPQTPGETRIVFPDAHEEYSSPSPTPTPTSIPPTPTPTPTPTPSTANKSSYGSIAYSISLQQSFVMISDNKEAALEGAWNKCVQAGQQTGSQFANDCDSAVWVKDGYMSIAVDAHLPNHPWGTGWGNTQASAESWAIKGCQDEGGKTCKIENTIKISDPQGQAEGGPGFRLRTQTRDRPR